MQSKASPVIPAKYLPLVSQYKSLKADALFIHCDDCAAIKNLMGTAHTLEHQADGIARRLRTEAQAEGFDLPTINSWLE